MKPVARSLLEVAASFGLLGWLYAAACAAYRPAMLAEPVAAVFPVRRDTFGVFCFVVSLLAAFALQVPDGSVFRRLAPRPGPLDAALRTVVVYGLLTWAYVTVNSLAHPETIGRRLTHFASVPTEGATAVVCFAGSAAALFVLRLRLRRRSVDAEADRGGRGA